MRTDNNSPEIWGISKPIYLTALLLIHTVLVAYGWQLIGKHLDAPEAFFIWLGASPLFICIISTVWDNYGRKILTLLSILISSVTGFTAGLAFHDISFFKRVIFHGTYQNDMAAYLGLICAANILAFVMGIVIHYLIGKSRKARNFQTFN